GSSRRAPVPCRRSRREGPCDGPRADALGRRIHSRAAARTAAPRRACAARPRKIRRPSRRAVSTYRPPENAPTRRSLPCPQGPKASHDCARSSAPDRRPRIFTPRELEAIILTSDEIASKSKDEGGRMKDEGKAVCLHFI